VGMGNQPVRTLRLPMNSGPVTALAAMANGRTLICASTDNVRMWDLDPTASKRSAVPFQIIPGHHGGCISSVFVDASSRYMLTTSGNRGWDGASNNVCLAGFMKGRPFVILDDYFVKDEFLASLHQNVDITELGIKQASNGKYYEISEGTPFLKRLFSHKHIASGHWVRADDVRITYSRWLYCVHMGMIFSVAAKYIAGLAVGPLVYTL
ncbi:Transcription factor spt8, partial [Coemansia sp. RSA 486]